MTAPDDTLAPTTATEREALTRGARGGYHAVHDWGPISGTTTGSVMCSRCGAIANAAIQEASCWVPMQVRLASQSQLLRLLADLRRAEADATAQRERAETAERERDDLRRKVVAGVVAELATALRRGRQGETR